MPAKSAADEVIESKLVVFAREHPENKFAYEPVEVLRGDRVDAPIDVFVDSATRRRLKSNSSNVVVLTRADRDKPWRSLGIADREYQAVVRRVLAFSDSWTGEFGPEKRVEFFQSLFGHRNRAIFDLAYLELGRAPYSTLKNVARSISPGDLKPVLSRREYAEWRSLAILLLGFSADPKEHALVRRSFSICERFASTTNLPAWATAYIEINKAAGVEAIEKIYLANPRRSESEIRAVVTALSVHGQEERTGLRDRIVISYGVALENHPTLAATIASDLRAWNRREYGESIAKILANQTPAVDPER
jgi:hypothetical protein